MEKIFGPYGYTADSFIGIQSKDLVKVGAPFMPGTSQYIGMNLLQLSSTTVVVEEKQTRIAKKLEAHGFEVLRVKLPYARDFGGSFHCITMPLYREREVLPDSSTRMESSDL